MVPSPLGIARPAAPAAPDQTRTVQPVQNTAPSAETHIPLGANTPISSLRRPPQANILPTSVDVSIKSANASLALLYRTAIDRINEQLAAELGPKAIADSGTPVHTPESTAGRILSLATALQGAYAARHPGEHPETVARGLVERVHAGFEHGLGEAKDILGGLGVLGGDSPLAEAVEKTHALVLQGLHDFLAAQQASQAGPHTTAPETP